MCGASASKFLWLMSYPTHSRQRTWGKLSGWAWTHKVGSCFQAGEGWVMGRAGKGGRLGDRGRRGKPGWPRGGS